MHRDGSVFHGMTPDGKNASQGDPKVNDLITSMKTEFDLQKQQSLAHDLIRYVTEQSYSIPRPSTSKGFTLSWPAIGNLGVDTTWVGATDVDVKFDYWVDSSKPPVGNA